MMNLLKPGDILITTKNNKFNPFTQYKDWREFDTDISHPYNTEAYYMRLLGLRSPDSFNSEQNSMELMQIFEEMIRLNNEIGNDVYEIITRDGTRMDHVPSRFLYK